MEWYFISVILSLVWSFYVVLSKYLYKLYDVSSTGVFVNTIIISSIICILFYPKEILIPEANAKYLLIVCLGASIFLSNFFNQKANELNMNTSIIDGLAISIYLPLVAIMLFFLFNLKISQKNILGIALMCIGSYLILQN